MPQEHAAYLAEPAFVATKRGLPPSTAPPNDDPLSRHALSYLNGGWAAARPRERSSSSARKKNPCLYPQPYRLVKEMRAKEAKAQTYHSFFRWSGQTEWTQERMGQNYIPRVIIWNEICTVSQPILETFLDWLDCRGVQVVCCGDQG
ncbi:MAG: hypothetical protein AB2556_26420 [Candidatus Thiodiazotropha sp.]